MSEHNIAHVVWVVVALSILFVAALDKVPT
jgi:hypothetical protein